MRSLDRPREAGVEQMPEADGPVRLAGLAGTLRGQGFTVEIEDERLRVTDGPDSRGMELECRRRPSDGDRWWFTWAGGIWLCEADRSFDAVTAVKGALRQVGR